MTQIIFKFQCEILVNFIIIQIPVKLKTISYFLKWISIGVYHHQTPYLRKQFCMSNVCKCAYLNWDIGSTKGIITPMLTRTFACSTKCLQILGHDLFYLHTQSFPFRTSIFQDKHLPMP